jgi:hypothetical protein
LVDEEEKETYLKYLNLPSEIPKHCTLDYYSYIESNPD